MTELEQLIYDNPNNMKLGAKIREKYGHRATVNNSESTSVTSHLLSSSFTDKEQSEFQSFPEIQLELRINTPKQEHDLKIQEAKQAFKDHKELEEEIDLNLAYTSARTTPYM